jgi:hypothetical protein
VAENVGKTVGKTWGKPENPWKTHGKSLEIWKKPMENPTKTQKRSNIKSCVTSWSFFFNLGMKVRIRGSPAVYFGWENHRANSISWVELHLKFPHAAIPAPWWYNGDVFMEYEWNFVYPGLNRSKQMWVFRIFRYVYRRLRQVGLSEIYGTSPKSSG